MGLGTKASKVRTSKKKTSPLAAKSTFNRFLFVRTFGCPVPTHGRGLNSRGHIYVLWTAWIQ